MNGRRRLGFVAAGATILAAAPLSAVFERWTWLVQALLAVALIEAAATACRMLRGPLWAQLASMLAALVLALTWLFPSGRELVGILPGPATVDHFGALLTAAAADIRTYGVPVPDRDGLLFICVLGVGGVAVLADLFTVGLHRPALVGLPMLAIYSVPVAVYTDSVPPLPFIFAAIGFLWLLASDNVDRVRRFGRRFTGDGRDVDVWEPSPLAAAGRRLAAVGVLLAVLVPLAVPGVTTGLLDRFGNGNGVGNGNGARGPAGSVNLFAELSGRLNQDRTEPLVRVTTDEKSPFYLRFGVADELTDEGFRSSPPSGQAVTRQFPLPDGGAPAFSGKYHATVEITDKFDMPLLPVYETPIRTDKLDSSWFYDANQQVIFSSHSRSTGLSYAFDYLRPRYTVPALRDAGRLATDDPMRQYARVPRVTYVDDLVTRLTRDADTEYDKVRAIYDYFSADNRFSYSLETKTGTSGSAIVDFLNNRTGFCEQYAAAMAWLVRAAGIPARVAFGFTLGNEHSGDTYVLTNRNLHAWTEVYFPGIGWVPFDATPRADVAGSVATDWAPDPNRPAPTLPGVTSSAGPGGTQSSGQDPAARDRRLREALDGGRAGNPIVPSASNWPWWTLGGSLALLILLALPALRRVTLRRRRHARFSAAARTARHAMLSDRPAVTVSADTGSVDARGNAHAAWDELLDTMIDFRLPPTAAETPRATVQRLIKQAGLPTPVAEGARLLARAEERARYARSAAPAAGLDDAMESIRASLAADATRTERLIATFLPPSVLLRWRVSIADALTRFVLALSRWRDAMTRLSPRRLIAGRAR